METLGCGVNFQRVPCRNTATLAVDLANLADLEQPLLGISKNAIQNVAQFYTIYPITRQF